MAYDRGKGQIDTNIFKTSAEIHSKFWDGTKNKLIRFYYYTQRGLALLNEFRYIVMVILATYALLKLKNPWIMVGMFVVCIPVLIVLGWFGVHHMAKVIEYLNVQFSTHWNRYNVKLSEDRNKLLQEIKDVTEASRKPDKNS